MWLFIIAYSYNCHAMKPHDGYQYESIKNLASLAVTPGADSTLVELQQVKRDQRIIVLRYRLAQLICYVGFLTVMYGAIDFKGGYTCTCIHNNGTIVIRNPLTMGIHYQNSTIHPNIEHHTIEIKSFLSLVTAVLGFSTLLLSDITCGITRCIRKWW